MTAIPVELAAGLWRWSTRHPDWHPGAFGAEVAAFAAATDDTLLLVDALLPADDPDAVLSVLDGVAEGRDVHVLVTIGYHVRSADALADRYGAPIWGPPNVASRLRDPGRLRDLAPGRDGPGGARAFAIGRSPRGERPLWLPSHRAVVFGDAVVVTPDGELRMWGQDPSDPRRRRFYAARFGPTLAPLADLEPDRILVTHGAPVLSGGAAALREALAAAPWDHRG